MGLILASKLELSPARLFNPSPSLNKKLLYLVLLFYSQIDHFWLIDTIIFITDGTKIIC